MSISQPASSDALSSPDHALSHRIIAADPSATVQSIGVNSDSTISILAGIKFPATQVPSADANTLDDYEEGTFTTTLTASTSGTITVRSAFNTGQYIKIGKMCFVSGYIEIDSVSSPIGTLIMNLPFTVDDTSDNSSRTIGTVLAVNLTEVKDNVAFICYESEAQTRLWLTDGVTGGYELAGYIQANTNIHFSLSFRTSS